MNVELFPELSVQGLRFPGMPSYGDVVNTIAAMRPEQLRDLVLQFTHRQHAAIVQEMEAMTFADYSQRRTLCGFPFVVAR